MKIGRLGFLKRLAVFAGVGGAVAVCAKAVAAKPAQEKLTRQMLINCWERSKGYGIAAAHMEGATETVDGIHYWVNPPKVLIVQPRYEAVARKILESTRGGH